jgi:two-component system cell cycle sensor histidine kinase/response regulator CckA
MPTAEETLAEPFASPGQTILIIDDNPTNLAVVGEFLSKQGLQVMVALNGELGLELARNEQPDLIVLDVLLPGIDGFETCRRLKADERTRAIPVIFTTIVTGVEDKLRGFAVGGVDYITKPFHYEEILARVGAHLHLRQLTQSLQQRNVQLQMTQEMLGQQNAQLQAAQAALHEANTELEQRIAARTVELVRANADLQEQIGERKRAEAALLAERNLLRTLIDHLPDSIYVKDRQSRFMLVNRALLEVLGLDSTEQVLGKSDADFFPPEIAAQLAVDERMVFETGQALLNHEESVARPQGASRWVLTSRVPVRDAQGQIAALVGVTRDITEHKSLQVQLLQSQKMECIGRLAGGVAHDFNNLLTAIVGYAELALATLAPDSQPHDDLLAILNAAERAIALTRQLLVFARKEVIAPQTLDLNELALTLDKLLRRLIGADVELVVREAPGAALVKADPHQIEQVLLNLAINSRDAMPDGGRLTIEIATVVREQVAESQHAQGGPAPYVMLAVSDTGVGMPPEVQSHVFEPFFTTKEIGKGTGLGLATCYGIVQQHGGQIEVSSKVGQGTVVKVYLPRVSEAANSRYVRAAPGNLPRGMETILLVEDEPMVRQLATRVLQQLGYTVLEAADGAEALRVAQRDSGRIDLLVTDMVMPQMNGNALADRLRAVYPQLKVMLISGYSDIRPSQRRLAEQGDTLLQKPFTSDLLARTVHDLLHTAPSPRQSALGHG